MSNENSFYQDILKGLGIYFDSPFIADIRQTAQRFPSPNLGYALNRNQVTSKKWLVDTLFETTGEELGRVCILGGWYGVLGAMLLHDGRFDISSVCSVDMDPSCEAVAASLNRTHAESGKFTSLTANMVDLDYGEEDFDLIINTSCEHLERIGDWFARIPGGPLLTLQSNNYYGIDGHVNCVDDLGAFKAQVPLSELLFEGERELPSYTRFMLIGRK